MESTVRGCVKYRNPKRVYRPTGRTGGLTLIKSGYISLRWWSIINQRWEERKVEVDDKTLRVYATKYGYIHTQR